MSNRPNHWPPPPPSGTTSSYPFPQYPASRSPTSTSHSGTSSSDASDRSPSSPMPLVVFSKLAIRGNGPADAIERMRVEFHRPGSNITDGRGVLELHRREQRQADLLLLSLGKSSRYTASIDDRAYIPVFEFPLGSQTIMIDSDSGYVLWTAIWKSLGNSKADIVKLVDSYDGLEEKIIKIRGGYLKIQGTWVPYEVALKLAQRVAFNIRHELVPLFGPTFPEECFLPGSLGYGQVTLAAPGSRPPRRTPRRMTGPPGPGTAPTLGRPPSTRTDWTSSNPVSNKSSSQSGSIVRSSSTRSVGSSAGGRESSGGSGGGERWSLYPTYPYPSSSSASSHLHSDPTYGDYYRPQQSPHSSQSPPSSYPASGPRTPAFHLPSPIASDPLLRSQHSESSLPPRGRQSTYSNNDAQVLRRFSTSLVDSPPLRDFGSSISSSSSFPSSSFGRSGPSSAPYRPPSSSSSPPSACSLPPILSLTPEFAMPGVPSSVARRTFQQQSQSYRILSAEEQFQRRRQGSPGSPGSSTDSQHPPSSAGSHGGSARGPLPPLGSHPSSTSSSSSSVFEGGPSSYLPPVASLDERPSLRTSISYSQRDRAQSNHLAARRYPTNIEVSPSTFLLGLRVDDSSPEANGNRRQGGVPMDVDRSSSQMTEKGPRYVDEHRKALYVGDLGVYSFSPERVEPSPPPPPPSSSSYYCSESAATPLTGSYYPPRGSEWSIGSASSSRMNDDDASRTSTTSVPPPPSPAEERQRSTSFRPW